METHWSRAGWTNSSVERLLGEMQLAALLIALAAAGPAPPGEEGVVREGRVVEIPFERRGQGSVLLVTVLLNGRRARFVLDTGAAASVVGLHRLGIEGLRLRAARFGRIGLSGEAVRVRTGSLKIAGRTFPEPSLVAMDLSETAGRLGCEIDGLLGQDLLGRFERVTIDFRRQVVEFAFPAEP